ncbi:NapH/MauN family ferredoxin-type protein [Candidatus Venteria ishoeyi]|uniref:Putative electron transport protein YccM n=1 Tax=Candidatus Venteria ishoeyi TaxID=1899563 RepID=A0A1H6FFY3_9GAMM|nr:NapH/MauN family ferredoxin-type protein [Candidatus Venteria ishoeyi]MDM8547898.1 NapH/MauN family ferredoxin-type protein [Candidatus Venteria ishoeyi]SEH08988.1 Putative electron transport protein YccM [Candidatus Venteria ishoeyi]
MKNLIESLLVLFGKKPRRYLPEQQTPEVKVIHQYKRSQKLTREMLETVEQAHLESGKRHRWRNRRWLTLIAVNLLFVVSFQLDIQILEGALTASRFIGFHMADLNSALQVMLAFKQVLINLLIGTVTVFLMWLLLGGRTFCSWVCPYHLVSEWAEKIHLKLAAKKLVKDHAFHRGTRTVLYLIFALLAVVTGYTVFETINPVGILSRALIYGGSLALLWVAFLLVIEIFYSRRAWCRYACPVGMTYGIVGAFSPLQVTYNVKDCQHEGECIKVCLVPHVLECIKKGRAQGVEVGLGADCTRCGMCIDTCPTGSLRFDVKGLNKLL